MNKTIGELVAAARAEGFADAIEAAAKVGESYGFMCRQVVIDAIRKLSPAKTEHDQLLYNQPLNGEEKA